MKKQNMHESQLFHLDDYDVLLANPLRPRNARPQRLSNDDYIRRRAHDTDIGTRDRSAPTTSGDAIGNGAPEPGYRTESHRGLLLLLRAAKHRLGCVQHRDPRTREHAKVERVLRDPSPAQTRAWTRAEHDAPPPGGFRYCARWDARQYLQHRYRVAQHGYKGGKRVRES